MRPIRHSSARRDTSFRVRAAGGSSQEQTRGRRDVPPAGSAALPSLLDHGPKLRPQHPQRVPWDFCLVKA